MNMNFRSNLMALALVGSAFSLSALAHADYTDTFTGGTNAGNWRWGGAESYQSGGNPGDYFGSVIDTFGPMLATDWESSSVFLGNYQEMGVTSISADFRVDDTDFPVGGDDAFSVNIRLVDTKGNFDPEDDDWAYFIGSLIPEVGGGWVNYSFAIDSQSADLPTGWTGASYTDLTQFNAGVTWGDLMTRIDRVEFSFLKPDYFAIFQNWTVGADNVSITVAPVPEPATMAALGLGTLLFARRRRK